MPLPGTVRSADSGAKGFDCAGKLAAGALQAARQNGFVFCLRYVSFAASEQPDDLTPAEATAILHAGLALMPVYPFPGDGWSPDGAHGTRNGTRAAANANSVGFPHGVSLWVDLEGVAAGTSAQAVIDYCNNWFDVVNAAGFVPGIYVGANAILNGDQLFSLKYQHYWKSGSTVPDIPTRGYQLVQTIPGVPPSLGGVSIDGDSTRTDRLGGNAQWLKL